MDPATLTSRVRGILRGSTSSAPSPVVPTGPHVEPDAVASVLGGVWQDEERRAHLVVDRFFEADRRHGSRRVGQFAGDLSAGDSLAPLLCGRAEARPPFLFFDLETTGLSGGAGTLAFLVGCGWFEADGFRTRQYVLTRLAEERPLLEAFAASLGSAGVLVSFNGRSFDAPLLETRYAFHRLAWAGEDRPHLDMLHPARRLWRADAGCSLSTLEHRILDAHRGHDVPGIEIPARFFHFLRTGDGRPLMDVLEHNRQDLLSLAGLTARFARLAHAGAEAARDGREALAIGHVFARAGDSARARDAYERAAHADGDPGVRADALRALAVDARRRRRFSDAAGFWRGVLNTDGCPPAAAREATAALAVHHEHRARDLPAAKTFALQSLEYGSPPGWGRAMRYRVARLDRKLERERAASLLEQEFGIGD